MAVLSDPLEKIYFIKLSEILLQLLILEIVKNNLELFCSLYQLSLLLPCFSYLLHVFGNKCLFKDFLIFLKTNLVQIWFTVNSKWVRQMAPLLDQNDSLHIPGYKNHQSPIKKYFLLRFIWTNKSWITNCLESSFVAHEFVGGSFEMLRSQTIRKFFLPRIF